MLFEVVERDDLGESLLMGDLQCAPRVFLGAGLGVEIMAFRVERGRVWIGGLSDATNACNARLRSRRFALMRSSSNVVRSTAKPSNVMTSRRISTTTKDAPRWHDGVG